MCSCMQQELYDTIQKIQNDAILLEEQFNAIERAANFRGRTLDARERAANLFDRTLDARKRKLDDRETTLRDGEVALAGARAELNGDIDAWTNGISGTQQGNTSPAVKQEPLPDNDEIPARSRSFNPPPKYQREARQARKPASTGIKFEVDEPLKGMTHNTCVHIGARL